MRIISKGQVTIPQAIREKMGLLPDTEVEFEVVRNKVVLRKMKSGPLRGMEIIARMKGKATVTMSTDEIMSHTRG